MRRLLLHATAIILGGFAALLAWMPSEARLHFIVLGVFLVGGLVWAAQRFPETRRRHIFGAALFMLYAGFTLAIVLPSTRVPCDCPPPPTTVGGYFCNCPVDHHIVLRVGIAVAGALGVTALRLVAGRC
jgi:hypothetical protein